jgi:cell division protein FtsI (penicillin-binding protein 3)
MFKRYSFHHLIESFTDFAHASRQTEINPIRLHTITAAFLVGFTIIIFRLFDVALFGHNNNVSQAANIVYNPLHRNDILDRNGVLLATNLATASLYSNPKLISDPKEVVHKLLQIFPELNPKQLLTELSSQKSFVWIKRNLTPKEQYNVNNLGIPGLQFEKGEQRIYPHGNLLSHVLGFVGVDGKGLVGIEKYFDKELSSSDPSQAPTQLVLSIDSRVQNIVSEELGNAIKEFRAIGGVGVVADANNGEIIAAVSKPDFDPHNPTSASQEQLFNRFSLGLYEPGSTFKTYTIAMALDSNTVNLHDSYNIDSPIQMSRFNIGDYHAKGGWRSIPEIFMYSSNIGVAKIALLLGKQKQKQFLQAFGLLEPIEIELPEKGKPQYPSDSRWGDLSTVTLSYGHGITVTALHMVRATAAMVNGGNLLKLTLVKQADSNISASKVIQLTTSEQMRKLLRLVVSHGTGKKANVEGYIVGGKTGTAHKNKNGTYSQNSRLSSFISAFPINDPKYVVYIMLDEPKGTQATGGYATAGMTAAPVAGEVISRIAALYGIEAVDESAPEVATKVNIEEGELGDELNSF